MNRFAFITLAGALFISSIAFAHVEPGVYVGVTTGGGPCTMTAGETYFDGVRHPLNERIKIKVGSNEYVVAHPPVINAAEAIASFNHDQFQGIMPIKAGAMALVIEMSHEEGFEGPKSFTLIEHRWTDDSRISLPCDGLKRVEQEN